MSVVSTLTSLSTLGVLVGLFSMSPAYANLVAVAIGTVPSFELNRRWVWSLGGHRIRLAQVVPFCLLSFAGLAIASLTVRSAGAATAHDPRIVHTIAVEIANLGSYGVLWVIQFVLCDGVLFRGSRNVQPRPDAGRLAGVLSADRGESHRPGGDDSQLAFGELARSSQNQGVY